MWLNKAFLKPKEFWLTIPLSRYLIFSTAIAFMFSEIGFITDIFARGALPAPKLYFYVVMSGVTAALYAYTFTRNPKFLPLIILLQVGYSLLPLKNISVPLTPDEYYARMNLDAWGILITVILGYIFLVIFINKEGFGTLRLRTEIKLAKEMHDTLVPELNFKTGRYEVFGIANPTDEVGGDLIDYFRGSESSMFYIADVSGHGVAAGLFMGMFKSAVHIQLNGGHSLASILNESNKTLYSLKKKNMFLTCSMLKLNDDHTAEYSCAGHLPILKLPCDGNNFEELLIKQIPISVSEDFNFTTNKTTYQKGDLFIMLTDGITEVSKGKDSFGLDRVKQIILDNRDGELSRIHEKINEKLTTFGKQKDDQTILFIRCI